MSLLASGNTAGRSRVEPGMDLLDAVVIGAGQAGLSAAYHLRRRGMDDVVVLDAEDGPGGAWRHRWDSLTMATVNGIRELPDAPAPEVGGDVPANIAVPAYFAEFEARTGLESRRPVRVTRVEEDPAGAGERQGSLLVRAVGADGRALPVQIGRAHV